MKPLKRVRMDRGTRKSCNEDRDDLLDQCRIDRELRSVLIKPSGRIMNDAALVLMKSGTIAQNHL